MPFSQEAVRSFVQLAFKTFLQGSQLRLHATVIDIASEYDSHSGEQRRIKRAFCLCGGAIQILQPSLDVCLQTSRQPDNCFHIGSVSLAVKPYKALKVH